MPEERLELVAEVPVSWDVSGDTACQYATNLVVQHTEHEFVISFFRVFPPLFVGSPEEVKEQADKLDEIKAQCVGRIVVAPERMPKFVKVLQENLDRFNQSMSED